MIRTLLSVLLLSITLNAQAETRYVSDELEIDMRSGTSNQHRILRMLPSGSALEVLEDDKASGYSRVQTSSGAEGWILSRYLQTSAPASKRLAETEKKLAELELQSRQRMAKLSESDKEFIGVTEELTRLKDEKPETHQAGRRHSAHRLQRAGHRRREPGTRKTP